MCKFPNTFLCLLFTIPPASGQIIFTFRFPVLSEDRRTTIDIITKFSGKPTSCIIPTNFLLSIFYGIYIGLFILRYVQVTVLMILHTLTYLNLLNFSKKMLFLFLWWLWLLWLLLNLFFCDRSTYN